MVEIYARIGITLKVSEREARQILRDAGKTPSGGNYEYDLDEDFARRFFEHGELNGDSYIPADMIREEDFE